jgi:HSP20 family molecular chaperone IbpA
VNVPSLHRLLTALTPSTTRILVGAPRALSPRMCVETELHDGWFQVRAEIPGIEISDVDITCDGGELVIRAKRFRRTGVRRSEIRYGSFARSVRLPEDANPVDITTNYDSGILHVWVPVSGAQPAIQQSIALPVTY